MGHHGGAIQGTPTTAGNYAVHARVEDSVGAATGAQRVEIAIQ
jgi:hypothetical protein